MQLKTFATSIHHVADAARLGGRDGQAFEQLRSVRPAPGDHCERLVEAAGRGSLTPGPTGNRGGLNQLHHVWGHDQRGFHPARRAGGSELRRH